MAVASSTSPHRWPHHDHNYGYHCDLDRQSYGHYHQTSPSPSQSPHQLHGSQRLSQSPPSQRERRRSSPGSSSSSFILGDVPQEGPFPVAGSSATGGGGGSSNGAIAGLAPRIEVAQRKKKPPSKLDELQANCSKIRAAPSPPAATKFVVSASPGGRRRNARKGNSDRSCEDVYGYPPPTISSTSPLDFFLEQCSTAPCKGEVVEEALPLDSNELVTRTFHWRPEDFQLEVATYMQCEQPWEANGFRTGKGMSLKLMQVGPDDFCDQDEEDFDPSRIAGISFEAGSTSSKSPAESPASLNNPDRQRNRIPYASKCESRGCCDDYNNNNNNLQSRDGHSHSHSQPRRAAVATAALELEAISAVKPTADIDEPFDPNSYSSPANAAKAEAVASLSDWGAFPWDESGVPGSAVATTAADVAAENAAPSTYPFSAISPKTPPSSQLSPTTPQSQQHQPSPFPSPFPSNRSSNFSLAGVRLTLPKPLAAGRNTATLQPVRAPQAQPPPPRYHDELAGRVPETHETLADHLPQILTASASASAICSQPRLPESPTSDVGVPMHMELRPAGRVAPSSTVVVSAVASANTAPLPHPEPALIIDDIVARELDALPTRGSTQPEHVGAHRAKPERDTSGKVEAEGEVVPAVASELDTAGFFAAASSTGVSTAATAAAAAAAGTSSTQHDRAKTGDLQNFAACVASSIGSTGATPAEEGANMDALQQQVLSQAEEIKKLREALAAMTLKASEGGSTVQLQF